VWPVTQPISAAAPEDVFVFFEIEDQLVRRGCLGEISAGGVLDAFGFCRRAARIQ
jgi:hypothetical protein